MSAYACEPGKGSEPEVGWRWMSEMSKHHDVVVVTRANNREVIENYLKSHIDDYSGVQFVYFDLSDRLMKWKKRLGLHQLYYLLWQYNVRRLIDRVLDEKNVDLVHLVTFASFRYPVFLSRLKVPVVWGPVGGAEQAPWSLLWYRLRFPACIKEIIRNVATALSALLVPWIDPTRTSQGSVIASTPMTQAVLHRQGIDACLMPTIGVGLKQPIIENAAPPISEGLRFIFVGRLVLLKGVHLLLDAFEKASLHNATLTIVGDGSERSHLEALAIKLGIGDRVKFVGQIPKQELAQLYAEHHVVVAPSLYESGGYMVLEGFQQCRPAIVLDVGGLAMSVDSNCGIKVPIGKGSEVVMGLADAMSYYQDNPESITKHGKSGYEKLNQIYAWSQKANQMVGVYSKAVQNHNKRTT